MDPVCFNSERKGLPFYFAGSALRLGEEKQDEEEGAPADGIAHIEYEQLSNRSDRRGTDVL